MPKVKKLTEPEVKKAYEVITGFNVTLEDGEQRSEVGDIVFEADFTSDQWAQIRKNGAVKRAVAPDPLKENEQIVFEVIDGDR